MVLFTRTHVATLWVIVALVIPQSMEYAFIRVCAQSQGGNEDDSNFSFRCSSGGIIRVLRVTLWRTNSNTICRSLSLDQLSRYTCPTLSIAVRQECHQQNNCQYTLTYPDQNDCPEETYLPDRPIVLRMDFICVRSLTIMSVDGDDETTSAVLTTMSDNDDDENDGIGHAMTATVDHNDHDKTADVIGAVVGAVLIGILSTVIVALAIVFVIRRRSQTKSASTGGPVTLENDAAPLTTQPNIYSTGFDDSTVDGATNAGYYMEIQDGTLDGKANAAQVSESDRYPRDGSTSTTKPDDSVLEKNNATYANSVVEEAPNEKSMYENALKPMSIVKAADETVIMDNDV